MCEITVEILKLNRTYSYCISLQYGEPFAIIFAKIIGKLIVFSEQILMTVKTVMD